MIQNDIIFYAHANLLIDGINTFDLNEIIEQEAKQNKINEEEKKTLKKAFRLDKYILITCTMQKRQILDKINVLIDESFIKQSTYLLLLKQMEQKQIINKATLYEEIEKRKINVNKKQINKLKKICEIVENKKT